MIQRLASYCYRLWAPLLAILLLALPMSALAVESSAPLQSRESIRAVAAEYAQRLAEQHGQDSDIEIEVGQLDSRLRLAACSVAPEAFESPNTRPVGRTTIGVRCDGDKPWKLYVSVNIQVMKPVAILKRAVTRNTPLQAADLAMSRENIAALHRGYFTSIESLLGKFTKNPMTAGTIVTPAQVKNPMAVKKGAQVTIVANLGGIEVRMKGKALKSGSLGDWVSVKNISSNRQIEGRVTGSGVIQVTL